MPSIVSLFDVIDLTLPASSCWRKYGLNGTFDPLQRARLADQHEQPVDRQQHDEEHPEAAQPVRRSRLVLVGHARGRRAPARRASPAGRAASAPAGPTCPRSAASARRVASRPYPHSCASASRACESAQDRCDRAGLAPLAAAPAGSSPESRRREQHYVGPRSMSIEIPNQERGMASTHAGRASSGPRRASARGGRQPASGDARGADRSCPGRQAASLERHRADVPAPARAARRARGLVAGALGRGRRTGGRARLRAGRPERRGRIRYGAQAARPGNARRPRSHPRAQRARERRRRSRPRADGQARRDRCRVTGRDHRGRPRPRAAAVDDPGPVRARVHS